MTTLTEDLGMLADWCALHRNKGAGLSPQAVSDIVSILNDASKQARRLEARERKVSRKYLRAGANVVLMPGRTRPAVPASRTLDEDLSFLANHLVFYRDSGVELSPVAVRHFACIVNTASRRARLLEAHQQKITQKHLCADGNIVLWPIASCSASADEAEL